MTLYDIILKGTDIKDCITARHHSSKKLLIVDKKSTYGNYTHKNDCIIENIPRLIRKTDPIIQELIDMNVHVFLDFIKIKAHIYFELKNEIWTTYKIPVSKNEIAKCDYLQPHEKFILNKLLNGEKTKNDIPEKIWKIFMNAVCGGEYDEGSFMRFMSSFDDYYFLYPIYGFKDISEYMSRYNAINGVVYLLDKDLEIIRENGSVKIESKHGTFESDKYVENSKNVKQSRKMKVLNLRCVFHEKLFYGVFNDGCNLIHCICLDSSAKICPDETYLLYLWKTNGSVIDSEIKRLGIKDEWIIFMHEIEIIEEFVYDVVIEYE